MKQNRNWVIGIILAATVGAVALQNKIAHNPGAETAPPSATFTDTPTATYEACGFMWAYHDDPGLSSKIDGAVRIINPSASANAQLFGEDCVYADGHSTFSTMETDFYVRIPVADLSAQEDLGNLVKQVMDLIVSLPENDIHGNPGFVEITFTRSEAERVVLRVGVYDYLKIPANLSGAELLNSFYTPSPPPSTVSPATATPTP